MKGIMRFVLIFCLSIIIASSETNQMNQLIDKIVDYYRIEYVLIFRDSYQLSGKHQTIQSEVIQNLKVPFVVLTDFIFRKGRIEKLWKYQSTNFLAITFYSNFSSQIFVKVDQTLLYMHHAGKFIFVSNKEMNEDSKNSTIHRIFNWSFENGMWNSLAVFILENGDTEIRNYKPFPEIKFSRPLNLNNVTEFFDNRRNINCEGYEVRIGDYLSSKSNYELKPNRIIVIEFLKRSNCSYKIIDRGINYEISLYKNNPINTLRDQSKWNHLGEFCIVIPYPDHIPQYKFVMITFKNEVWISLIVAVFYLTILLYVVQRIRRESIELGEVFLNVLQGLLYQPPARFMSFDGRLLDTVRIQVLISGFILTTMYLSILFNFRTDDVYEPQVNTIEDLWKSKHRLQVIDNNKKDEIIKQYGIPQEYHDIITINKSLGVFQYSQVSLILNFKYVAVVELYYLWLDYIREHERYSSKKHFHISDICHCSRPYIISVKEDWKFSKRLNDYITYAFETGHFIHWESQYISRLSKRPKDTSDYSPKILKVEDFSYIWIFLFIGYGTSFLCFITEHIIWFLKRKTNSF